MRALLIGANGQLGTDIIATKPAGIELKGLTRKELDITHFNQLREVLLAAKPDVLINTAAYHKTDACEDDPELTFKVNAIAVREMAQIINELNGILVHISTDYVYDGKKKPIPYTEVDPPNPLNTYGIAKLAGEIYLSNITEKHYRVRVSSLFGKAGASAKGGNFVTTVLRRAQQGESLRVINDAEMSPTYTMDAAKEIWRLITEQRPFGVYHVTNGGHCSWYAFAKQILKLSGLKNDVIPIDHTEYFTKAKRPLWSPLESVKDIHLRPWEEALEEFL